MKAKEFEKNLTPARALFNTLSLNAPPDLAKSREESMWISRPG